jgi:PAS domain S-box-containing protein
MTVPFLHDEAFRAIVDNAPDGIVLVDAAGQISYVNRQITELFGYAAEALQGQRVELLMPEDRREIHVIHREIYQERPETRPMGTGLQLVGRRFDGSTFPVEISLSRLSAIDEVLSVAVVRDVSRQRRAEEALRRSEERHRLLAEQAQDIIFRYRVLPTPGFEYMSAAMWRLLGYQPEEFYVDSQLVYGIVHPDDRSLLEQALTINGPRDFVIRLAHRNGGVRWFEHSMSPVADSSGVVVALEGIARDVTARRAANDERQRLVTEVERQLERERIAGDLHDETIQSIYAVGLGLHAALADESVTKEVALQHTIDGLNSVIIELRTYMQGLSGQTEGAVPESLAIRIEALLREPTSTRWSANIARDLALDPVIERQVYLLAKELISNVQRHAHAAEASLLLARGEGADSEMIRLRVSDDGSGFDRAKIPPHSFGFRSIEQRVDSLGGSLQVESAVGAGTTVEVTLPSSPPPS